MKVDIGTRGDGERGRRAGRAPSRLHLDGIQAEQAERAAHLEKIGRHRYADRVRLCGAKDGILEFRRCGLRCCPRCAARIAEENAARIEVAIREMTRPVVGVFTFTSSGLHDLPASLDALACALKRLRREAPGLGIRRLIGALHPKLAGRGDCWNAHVHVAVDVRPERLQSIASRWRQLTRRRGTFEVEGDRRDLHDVRAYAAYVAREDDWCGEPSVTARVLDALITAMRHRRLVIRWGFRRRFVVWRVGAGSLGAGARPRPGPPRAGGRQGGRAQ